MKKRMLLICVLIPFVLSGCIKSMDKTNNNSLDETLYTNSEVVKMDNKYKEIDIDLDSNVSNLMIYRSKDKFIDANFRYNSEDLKPNFKFFDGKIDISNNQNHFSSFKVISEWDVGITDKIPVNLGMISNSSSISLDADYIKLNKMDMELNASEMKLYCNKLNVNKLNDISMDVDASDVGLFGVGNLNYDNIKVKSSASTMSFDLTGEYLKSAEIELDAKASSIRIILPKKINTKITVEKSDISTIIVNNNKISSLSKKVYEYKASDYTNLQLDIKLRLNVTTVTLE